MADVKSAYEIDMAKIKDIAPLIYIETFFQ